eukprot:4199116-Alexandrium_andersonii.AAC.1
MGTLLTVPGALGEGDVLGVRIGTLAEDPRDDAPEGGLVLGSAGDAATDRDPEHVALVGIRSHSERRG